MRRTFSILVLWGALLATVAQAASLPPVGQRRYVIDGGSPYAPVKIQPKAAPTQGTYLKDPLQPSGPIRTPPPLAAPKPAKAPAMRAAQLRFKKLPVGGAAAKPRVEFSRETLPLSRADEPVALDFFDKVYAPAKDDGF
jgi:hypothetical protein